MDDVLSRVEVRPGAGLNTGKETNKSLMGQLAGMKCHVAQIAGANNARDDKASV